MIRNETKQHDTIRHNTIRYDTVQYDTMRCDATPHTLLSCLSMHLTHVILHLTCRLCGHVSQTTI